MRVETNKILKRMCKPRGGVLEENVVKTTITIDEINFANDPTYYSLLKFYVVLSLLMTIFSLLIGEFLLTAGFIIIMILAASVVKY